MPRGIIQWSPFRDLDNFFDEGNLSDFDFSPAMDVYQKDENVVVEMPISGIDPKNIDISIDDNVLTVSGRSEDKKEIKEEDYYRKEIREGSFSRTVALPVKVKEEKTEAIYEKGVLKISIPKTEEPNPKKIAVKIKEK